MPTDIGSCRIRSLPALWYSCQTVQLGQDSHGRPCSWWQRHPEPHVDVLQPVCPLGLQIMKITKSVDTRLSGYIVLYIPTETLFTRFNARLTDSGQVVTEHVTPFSFIRGGWFQDSQLRWVRLMVPSGPEQAIRTAIKLSHVASKESCSGSHLLASQAKPRRATRRSRLRG